MSRIDQVRGRQVLDSRGGAIGKQAGGDDVGLGEFVEPKRERAEFDCY